MRILIDMNLSPLWLDAFREQGLEAEHWSRVGEPGAPDPVLLEWARAEGYIVSTHDLDFSRLLALTRSEGPSVVQLRSQRVLPGEAGPLVIAALRQHSELLEKGALVVIDASSSRARVLPIR